MPPVAHTAVAFAAGLWVGRALFLPWSVLLLSLGAAALLRRTAPWGATLFVILAVGGAHGRWLAERERYNMIIGD